MLAMRLPTTSTAAAVEAPAEVDVDATKWQRARARQVNLIVQKMANFPRRPTAAANAGGTSRSVWNGGMGGSKGWGRGRAR